MTRYITNIDPSLAFLNKDKSAIELLGPSCQIFHVRVYLVHLVVRAVGGCKWPKTIPSGGFGISGVDLSGYYPVA